MNIEQARAELERIMLDFDCNPPSEEDAHWRTFRQTVLSHKAGFSNGRMCHPRLPNRVHRRLEELLTTIAPSLGDKSSHLKFGITEHNRNGRAGATVDLYDEHGNIVESFPYRFH